MAAQELDAVISSWTAEAEPLKPAPQAHRGLASMPGDAPATDIEYHPLSALFPLLEGEAFDEFVADIKAHGLREPIILYQGKILDGRNRHRACIEAGVKPLYCTFSGSHADAQAYVVSVNICRRHLTPEQKRQLIKKLLEANPEQSDRQIAKKVKVHHETVSAARKQLEGRGGIRHVEKRIDTKGRQQPAAKIRVAKPVEKDMTKVAGPNPDPGLSVEVFLSAGREQQQRFLNGIGLEALLAAMSAAMLVGLQEHFLAQYRDIKPGARPLNPTELVLGQLATKQAAPASVGTSAPTAPADGDLDVPEFLRRAPTKSVP